MSYNRPTKRRRTKAILRVTEDDDALADGSIVKTTTRESSSGPIEERIEIPVWSNKPELTIPSSTTSTAPTIQQTLENQQDPHAADLNEFFRHDTPENDIRGSRTSQAHYIQEFVDRVQPMLKALLSREVLPRNTICGHCPKGNIAIWRCRDCTAASILCRSCIRDCHMEAPTHRIEVWSGNYFRRAELWEVGLYILVTHHEDPHLCATLQFQNNILRSFQVQNDATEQEKLSRGAWNNDGSSSHTDTAPDGKEFETDERRDDIDDDENFTQFSQRLDEMYKQTHTDENSPDHEDDDEHDLPVDELEDIPPLPDNYIPTSHEAAGDYVNDNLFSLPSIEIPHVDALNNPYVRVVHTNGVHHIGLVYCTCRGKETTHADLMAAGLVPTSFERYKTIFTHGVLDDFRLTNLECKASAYQYFQKIRRQTSPMSPDSVPNLYHELRRMSRLWRWMKKLKWAGMAHRRVFTTDPEPGELANFCPTCPQPGINIPDDWAEDIRR